MSLGTTPSPHARTSHDGPAHAGGRDPAVVRRDPVLPALAALVAFVVGSQAAGLVGLPFTDREPGGWYDTLDKPPFNPPSWVFGPVWTTLYLLIGVAAWLVWRSDAGATRRNALVLFAAQLALNALWTPLFFGAEAPGWALAEIAVLLVAAVATLVWFARVNRVAAALFAPYVAWVGFATVLNASIVVLNR